MTVTLFTGSKNRLQGLTKVIKSLTEDALTEFHSKEGFDNWGHQLERAVFLLKIEKITAVLEWKY